MIKSGKGKTKLNGTPAQLLKELTYATKAMVELLEEEFDREMAIELTRNSIELAFKTEEELRKEAHEKFGKLLTMLAERVCNDLQQEGEQKDE